jgi:hypothetical protein
MGDEGKPFRGVDPFAVQDAGDLSVGEVGSQAANEFDQLRLGDVSVLACLASGDLERGDLSSVPMHISLDVRSVLGNGDDNVIDQTTHDTRPILWSRRGCSPKPGEVPSELYEPGLFLGRQRVR